MDCQCCNNTNTRLTILIREWKERAVNAGSHISNSNDVGLTREKLAKELLESCAQEIEIVLRLAKTPI